MSGHYRGEGPTLDEAANRAVELIPPRPHFDYAVGRVVEWGLQRGGFVDERIFYVIMEEDPDAPPVSGSSTSAAQGCSAVGETRGWAAKEGTDFAGGNRRLTVTGEVLVSAGNVRPMLTRAVPQGVVDNILLLDLALKDAGDVGTGALEWKPVSYEEPVERHQFRQVEVRGHVTIEVEKIIS